MITIVNKKGEKNMGEENSKDCHITNAEWQIMKVVWANREVTSKFVAEVLCERMEWKKATIKTLLNRLLEKKVLRKREEGNKYVYFTEYSQEELSKKALMEVFGKICRTKSGELIVKAIEENELSFSDLNLIEKAIEAKKKFAVEKVKCDCLPGQCNCEEHDHCRN